MPYDRDNNRTDLEEMRQREQAADPGVSLLLLKRLVREYLAAHKRNQNNAEWQRENLAAAVEETAW